MWGCMLDTYFRPLDTNAVKNTVQPFLKGYIPLNKDTFLIGTFNKVPTLHDFTPSNEDTLLIRTLC